MSLLGFLVVGIVTGIVAHLILGNDGYSYFGEIVLGCLGAILFGLVAGIFYGMKVLVPEVIVLSIVGATLVLTVVVLLTLRARGGHLRA